MGKHRFKKPEDVYIRGICVLCNRNPQKGLKGGKFRPLCCGCDRRQYNNPIRGSARRKSTSCAKCGFVAENPVQLDIDHINGIHSDNSPENIQTLCANCHRLKTWQNREFNSVKHRTLLIS
jgi:5-methylcytosine-specific restriction endonuclease McrA